LATAAALLARRTSGDLEVPALVAVAPEPALAEVERDALGRVGELPGQRGALSPDADLDRCEQLQDLERHLECVELHRHLLAGPVAPCGRALARCAEDAHGS
jgi:hypothetical protein